MFTPFRGRGPLAAACLLCAAETLLASSVHAAPCPVPKEEVNAPSGTPLSVDEGAGRTRLLYEESHALLIGESRYASGSGWRTLSNVPAEVAALSAALRLQGFHVVRHEDLGSADLPAAIECFVRTYGYRRDARVFMYFAGHGFTRTDNQTSGERTVGYVLPVDAPKAPLDTDATAEAALLERALRLTRFQEWASAMEARHVLMVFDSCFSGAVLGHRGSAAEATRPRPLNYVLSDAAQRPVRWFLTAGMANQTVPAESVFNSLLVQALSGFRPEADVNRDGFLTSGELVQYLKGTVPNYNSDQTPDDGKMRDPLFDVGDMAFRLPDRLAASGILQAAAASTGMVLAGQALDSAAVKEIARPSRAPPPAPVVLRSSEQSDLATAVQELESRDTTTRRRARTMLSRLLASNGPGFTDELVRGLPHGSYRFQLGVSEALSNARGGWSAQNPAEAVRIMRARYDAVKDASLKIALSGALRNAR